MKYTIELDSPDMRLLVDMLDGGLVRLASQHALVQASYGRGHELTVLAGRREEAGKRIVNAVDAAVKAAAPERSTGTNEGALLTDPDEMFQGTSRPMRRVKASNLRRRS